MIYKKPEYEKIYKSFLKLWNSGEFDTREKAKLHLASSLGLTRGAVESYIAKAKKLMETK